MAKHLCDKRDRAISCVFCRDLHLTPMFSGPLQEDLFKSCFKQNNCHACHTRFAIFFPPPFCCVSSLIGTLRCAKGEVHENVAEK